MPDIKLLGTQREMFPKHLFLVQVPGGWSAGFQSMTELGHETTVIEYNEGGSLIPWKLPGRVTVPDVTLSRGASTSKKFYEWALQVSNITVGAFPTRGNGLVTPFYLKDLKVIQMDRDAQTQLRVWRLRNAWPNKVIVGDWDAGADEVIIEQLTLAFDFYELVR